MFWQNQVLEPLFEPLKGSACNILVERVTGLPTVSVDCSESASVSRCSLPPAVLLRHFLGSSHLGRTLVPRLGLEDAPALGFQFKDSLQFNCDVGIIALSPAFLHLLRLEWSPWEYKWLDPLTQCNSDAEYDTDIEQDAAAYGPHVDDPYGTW